MSSQVVEVHVRVLPGTDQVSFTIPSGSQNKGVSVDPLPLSQLVVGSGEHFIVFELQDGYTFRVPPIQTPFGPGWAMIARSSSVMIDVSNSLPQGAELQRLDFSFNVLSPEGVAQTVDPTIVNEPPPDSE
jgi:hypothetical protein